MLPGPQLRLLGLMGLWVRDLPGSRARPGRRAGALRLVYDGHEPVVGRGGRAPGPPGGHGREEFPAGDGGALAQRIPRAESFIQRGDEPGRGIDAHVVLHGQDAAESGEHEFLRERAERDRSGLLTRADIRRAARVEHGHPDAGCGDIAAEPCPGNPRARLPGALPLEHQMAAALVHQAVPVEMNNVNRPPGLPRLGQPLQQGRIAGRAQRLDLECSCLAKCGQQGPGHRLKWHVTGPGRR